MPSRSPRAKARPPTSERLTSSRASLTGFALGRSFRQALLIAVAAALVAVVSGIVLAYILGIGAAGAIVLTALLILGAATLKSRTSARTRSAL